MNIIRNKLCWKSIYFYCFFNALSLMLCVSLHCEEIEVVSIKTIVHYGEGLNISDMYVNGNWTGSHGEWGGGASSVCCIELSGDRTKPVLVSVKWETCDVRNIEHKNGRPIDPEARCLSEWHESTVPINFTERNPRHHFGLVIHILPGHKIEAWTADKGILQEDYPGPRYPSGPTQNY